MKKFIFLTVDQVLALHATVIEAYGGRSGIRDYGLLESAVFQVQTSYQYGLKDIFELAATYFYTIIKNHAFIDGNKRTGVAAALTFLALNDLFPVINKSQLYDLALQTAQSLQTQEDIAQFFRFCCKKSKKLK